MTEENPTPSERTDEANIREHTYDGIQEYDNPMPAWWLWLLWATVAFTPVYILGVHVFDFIPSYEDDLQAGQAELAAMREAGAAAGDSFEVTPETMARFIGVAEQIEAGAETFATNCMMCHGDRGQGLIGPNLADPFWIHGGSDEEIFDVITNGVPAKGMTPWGAILRPEQRAQLVAFIRSIAGSNPPGGKGPEGERDDTAESEVETE